MIDPAQIPDEVVEAAAAFLHGAWEEATEFDRKAYKDEARATIAAAINAWPGVGDEYPGDGTPCLILPVPQETA